MEKGSKVIPRKDCIAFWRSVRGLKEKGCY
jgi:hypothetical protein